MSIIMRTLAVILFAAAATATFGGESFEDAFSAETEFVQVAPEMNEVKDLMSAISKLRSHAPQHLSEHMRIVTKHAKALQLSQDADEEEKADAYTHNNEAFRTASKNIKAALDLLRGELKEGHNHDEKILTDSKNTAASGLSSARSNNKDKVKSAKDAGCPTKRAEEKADTDKKAAKKARDDVKSKNICPLETTWDDMNIHTSVIALGTELSGAWEKAREDWLKKNTAYIAATKKHEKAIIDHGNKMAVFKTDVETYAKNTHDSCQQAHVEYEALKKEVQSNVETRKQVDMASRVVQCYVDHMTNNASAKECADKARGADLKNWNIDGGSLANCESTESLENAFGPKSWTASKTNCAKQDEEVEEFEDN